MREFIIACFVLFCLAACGTAQTVTPAIVARATDTRVAAPIATAMPARRVIAPCENVPAPYAGKKSPYALNDAAAIAEGKKIFDANCAICHGKEGRGDGEAIALLDITPANFTDKAFMEKMPVDCHFFVISEGVISKHMPAWKQLGEDAIWKVLIYERAFTGAQ